MLTIILRIFVLFYCRNRAKGYDQSWPHLMLLRLQPGGVHQATGLVLR